jgi:CBS domain-containing protein
VASILHRLVAIFFEKEVIMSLRKIVKEELIHCSPETSVQEVATLMKDEDIGAVVVMESDRAVGIVTDRDLALRCICEGLDAEKTRVLDVMTKRIVTVNVEHTITDAICAMQTSEVRRLIVVDKEERPVGLISFGDLFQLLASELMALAAPATPNEPKLKTTEKVSAAA